MSQAARGLPAFAGWLESRPGGFTFGNPKPMSLNPLNFVSD